MKTPIYHVLKSSNKSENFRLKGRKGWNCSREHIGLKGLDYAAMDYSILHNSTGIEGFLSKDSIVSMTPDFPHQSCKKFKAWENLRLSSSGGYPFIQASYRANPISNASLANRRSTPTNHSTADNLQSPSSPVAIVIGECYYQSSLTELQVLHEPITVPSVDNLSN